MIRGTRQKLRPLDGAVSPRQFDDGYIVDHRYHISQKPFPRCWRFFRKIPAYVQNFHALSPPDPDCLHWPSLTTDLPETEKRRSHFSSATPYDRHQFGLGQWRSLQIGCLVEWTLQDLWRDLSHRFINGVHPSQASLQSNGILMARKSTPQVLYHTAPVLQARALSLQCELGRMFWRCRGTLHHSGRGWPAQLTVRNALHLKMNSPGSETWVYKSCSYLVFSICNAALKQHRIVGLWTCLAQISTARKSEY